MKKSLLLVSFSIVINTICFAQDSPKSTGSTNASNTVGVNTSTVTTKKKRCCFKKKKTKAITHSSPNQAQLDSIKKTKTDTKFK